MDFFDILTLIGGLCLFLYGMSLMGDGLERRAGSKLNDVIGRLTTNRFAGFLTGMGVTAIIQSSSATTVMVVGFVNSGLMTLKQSIGVIMGANIGTTITAWILSLGGIESDNFFVQLLKPTSFTPVLALIGIMFQMFSKSTKKKDTGTILLGFAVLMFGMDTMAAAVEGLADVPQFREMFIMFKNPILGVIAGAILTAIIQSSSASVGILQALTVTGQITYGAAFPIIMGQNIGTCITAILSSFGTNRNAKRVALAHLSFNVIGTLIMLIILYIAKIFIKPPILDVTANYFGIAVAHSAFNVMCTVILFPLGNKLEMLVCKLVPDTEDGNSLSELDKRLLATPAIALEACRNYTIEMAKCAAETLSEGIETLFNYKAELAESVRAKEEKTDHFEDVIGNYLVRLSAKHLNRHESAEAARLLKLIGDFERISDHGVNIVESAEELREKEIKFSGEAQKELSVICKAVDEIVSLTVKAFKENDARTAAEVEPLEEVVDNLKETLRENHIARLQKGECGIEAGFVWADLLINLERTSDHCSNVAECIMETDHSSLIMHENMRELKADNDEFLRMYDLYSSKYTVK